MHRLTLVQGPAGERLERQQGAGDAVARAVEAHVDYVSGLLSAERPFAGAQLLQDVAIADLCRRDGDAGSFHRGVKAVVGHHGDHYALSRESPRVLQM